MEYQFIRIQKKGTICRVTLNRPEKQNALHAVLIDELSSVFKHLAKDESVRFVVLDGEGKSFCSGADLDWFSGSTQNSEKVNKVQFELLAKMLRRLHNLPQVTIALGKGNIFGGGIGLASACDFVLMEESAVLAFSEVHLGLVPATILPFVAVRIKQSDARKLMLTGKYFDGKQAWEIGLADFLFSEGDLEKGLNDLISDLQKPVIEAVHDCKKLINEVYSGEIGVDDWELTAKVLVKRIASAEARERIDTFLKKVKK